MKKPNRPKRWRVNFVVDYYDYPESVTCHDAVLQILVQIASIHKLDYMISEPHVEPSPLPFLDGTHRHIQRLAYFRSGENSNLTGKQFRSAIYGMFDKAVLLRQQEVSVYHQHYKVLSQYPFPAQFYRPSFYPLVEFYDGSKKKLYIYSEGVMRFVDDYPLN